MINWNKNLTVLGLNNNFYGSYSSNQTFFKEMMSAFRVVGIRVLTASTVEEAMKIFETEDISFSLSFSKYKYYFEGKPLYDIYKVSNYQWVSDNPLKMNLDLDSKWIKYIFIDNEYPLVLDKQAVNEYLFRPLGFLERNLMKSGNKNGHILVPCKIRNLNKIYDQINDSSMSKLMKKFLEGYDRSSSFIKAITRFFQQEAVENPNDKELIFRLTNEYTRVEKRLWTIEHIDTFPIDVLSEDFKNDIKNKNVNFLTPVDYSMMQQVINNYSYVINVDPNYHSCIHDRFIKVVSSGSICITNDNDLISNITPLIYSFDKEDSIMQAIALSEKDDIYEKQKLAILPYSWEKSAQIIINDYIKGW